MTDKEYCDGHSERTFVSSQNCANIREIEKLIEDKIFPAIYERISVKVFLTVIVIAISFMGGAFGMLYNLNSSTQDKIEIVGKELGNQLDSLSIKQEVLASRFTEWIKNAPPQHQHTSDGKVIRQ